MTITLSILDQSPVGEREEAEVGIKNTVRLAEAAEELGYHRFWVSEHHNSSDVAGSAPEALIGYLIAKTKTLKIGSGGVMLQHYSPYKVAEVFHVLSSLAPNRVDLGIGKAPGGSNLSTQALQEDKLPIQKEFDQKLNDLKKYIHDEGEKEDLKATPITRTNPEIFLLGGSVESAELAAKLGISFVFAYFINGDEKILQEARNQFKKHSPKDANNSFLLALTVVVAEDDLKAISYIKQKETIKIIFSDGRKLNAASFEHAEKLISENNETEYQLKIQKAGYVAGSKETVKNNIENLLNKNDINEIVVLSPIVDIQERIHSYRLLKEIFEVSTNDKEKISEGLGVK